MIIARIQKHKKHIAAAMTWLFAMQITLPAFAGGGKPQISYTTKSFMPLPRVENKVFREGTVTMRQSLKDKTADLNKNSPLNAGGFKKNFSEGPSQPEMSTFKSASSDNMVDPFSGDFSYNIPLLDVGGYPVNIHYNSNLTMDQESSWVGLGWNINPGTISRNMRGLPDDFNGDDIIEKTVHTKPNINLGLNVGGGLEIFGKDLKGPEGSVGITYDNYKGYGIETGLSLKSPLTSASKGGGQLSGGLSFTNSSTSGLSVAASLSYDTKLKQTKKATEQGEPRAAIFGGSLNYSSRAGLTSLSVNADGNRVRYREKGIDNGITFNTASIPASMTFTRPTFTPGTEIPYTSLNFSFNINGGGSFGGVYGKLSYSATVSKQYIENVDVTRKYAAYGYLHYSQAVGNKNALLDYNRENDGPYVDKVTPVIAIPNYTYDTYIISAEGTGGSFRPYRSDVGFVHSAYNKTNSGQLNIGFDGGFKHLGGNIKPVYSTTTTNAWLADNKLKSNIAFQSRDSVYEDVVFRNPMEMPIPSQSYMNAIGHDTLIRPVLEGNEPNAILGNSFAAIPNGTNTLYNIQLAKPIIKEKREKRNQVISYLTSEEAAMFGLDKKIKSFSATYTPFTHCPDNDGIEYFDRVDSNRKGHHISEVTVLNEDGRRYIYGIPAYTLNQQNLTFAVKKDAPSNDDKGLTSYTAEEVSVNNKSGVDGYYSREVVPGYAHSFLLSGILSPDYVDVTGNGITDDDLGDAVEFNYTCIYNKNNPFGWRTPSQPDKAALHQGLKTYSRDDKASIVYGQKEIWYLHSIVSKNLVAVFRSSKDRSDVVSRSSINGTLEQQKKLEKLNRIDLYTKADLVANGTTAKPIKSVFFVYDYSLCPGAGDGGTGKLTLKKIYFTYNGNNNKKSNSYIFDYKGLNPVYHPKNIDAWGNYKNKDFNPGGLTNEDYPYIVQGNKMKADENAAAWCLTDITLPAGGAVKVTYESDDYGYVQNKKAMQLYSIAGLGSKPSDGAQTSSLKQKLYGILTRDGSLYESYRYIFVNVSDPVYTKSDVTSKYLAGVQSLYLKFFIKMPSDRWGSGGEFVPMVCEVEDYNVVPGLTNRIWIKIKDINGQNPLIHYALQFLKENLPSKAYPGSETGTDPDLKGLVNMLTSQFRNIKEGISNFDNLAKIKGVCKDFEAGRSFIKLNNPTFNKLGGGLRVKRIEIFDNFDKMTSGQMKAASYGQEYDYTTTATVVEKGVPKTINISSGVATYEPFIGGEENALKGYYAYQEQMNKLGPVSFKFIDTPFAESFYPSASVGYSRVTIRTINKQYISSNGKEVYTFYTYKDFPTQFSFTPFDGNSRKRYQPAIANFLKINAQHDLALSQGFKVELNDMHGKLRSHAFYSESDLNNPFTYTENIYRTKSIAGSPLQLDGNVQSVNGPESVINTKASMGQSAEIMMDLREQSGSVISANVELNVDVIGFFPVIIPVPGFFAWPQWEKTRFRSACVLKVVNNYGILDSVYHVDKGSIVSTKNLVYDAETGNVVLTRTNNEYKDPVYDYNYPAHWAYSGMGMAYENIHAVYGNSSLNLKNGRLFYNDDTPVSTAHLESGDECSVKGKRAPAGVELGDIDCKFVDMPLTTPVSTFKAWVLDANKKTASPPELFFIDEDGKPVNAKGVTVKILRSGKRNLTNASIGTTTMMTNPIVADIYNNLKIIETSDKNIINTSATTFKDCWKVDNGLYAKDSCFKILDTIYNQVCLPQSSMLMRHVSEHGGTQYQGNVLNSINLNASIRNYHHNPDRSETYRNKSIIEFNFSGIPPGATVLNAQMSLYARWAKEVWTGQYNNNENWTFQDRRGATYEHAHYWETGADGNHPEVSNNNSILQRVTGPWSSTTWYNNVIVDPSQTVLIAGTPNNSCVNRTNIDVKNIVSNIINSNSNYGIMMSLQDPNNHSSHEFRRVMTFCTGLNVIDDDESSTCSSCFTPSIAVTYQYQKDVCVKLCKQNITETTNPYRWGIYGNWRMDRSYIFYGDRKESAAMSSTDIRTNGTLKDFIPFWTVSNQELKPTVDTVKWVWNSATTLVNSKGLEVENVDALGRFNSGQYGYNNSLPVAVVQNSKRRESVFEGFEDYQYKNEYCDVICPDPRFADFSKGGGTLSKITAHTGLYSLKQSPNAQPVTLEYPLYNAVNDTILGCTNCGVKTEVDSTALMDTVVTGSGTGLNLTITDINGYNTLCNLSSIVNPIDFNASEYMSQCHDLSNGYNANWTGYIQPRYSGDYIFTPYFYALSYLNVTLYVLNQNGWTPQTVYSSWNGSQSIILTAGTLYKIEVQALSYNGNGSLQLYWQNNTLQNPEPIPAQFLYVDSYSSSGTVQANFKKWCVKIQPPTANVDTFLTLPHFSPIKGTKSIVSVWVKEDQPCSGSAYTNAQFEVNYDVVGSPSIVLKPTGVIIEGWQRMESDPFVINASANKLKLKMYSTNSSVGFYVDDIRIHPYNANMKSFVYNPVNLRLMAELDENNYASFYEYDDDGTLTRVKKETERGIKTIKETRSAETKNQ